MKIIFFLFKGKFLFLLIESKFNKVGYVADFESEREKTMRGGRTLCCAACAPAERQGSWSRTALRRDIEETKVCTRDHFFS